MMVESLSPGETPVSLNEARGWLRLGTTIDDAVIAGLVRAATNICEAFIGQWLMVRMGEEVGPLPADRILLGARPVVAVDSVILLSPDGSEQPLGEQAYRVTIARDGSACVAVAVADSADAVGARIIYRAGMAEGANGVPEAIRQGIIRMTQHLHDARDGAGAAPPAAIAALWQPWRRVTLGSVR